MIRIYCIADKGILGFRISICILETMFHRWFLVQVLTNQSSSEVVKASDKIEDVQVETADISSKFKFFETYKAPEKQKKAFRITPPREGQVKVNFCVCVCVCLCCVIFSVSISYECFSFSPLHHGVRFLLHVFTPFNSLPFYK